MLTFLCWRWRPQPGYRSIFPPESVTKLRDAIGRHYRLPHRFLCITDAPAEIDRGIETMRLWSDHARLVNPTGRHNPSCYRRLKVFAPGAREIFGERIVSMDLDTVIVDEITPLFERDEDFVIWGQSDFPTQWYNGSLWMLRTGTRDRVWTEFDPANSPRRAARAGCKGSDQGWLRYILGSHEATWGTSDGVYSHRVHIEPRGNVLPANARIVFWHGKLDPLVAARPINPVGAAALLRSGGVTSQAWQWRLFKGSPQALRLAARDLAGLDAVVARVPARRVAVQAGGNLGIWPKHLSKAFATVYTFEPAPALFPQLVANAPEANIVRLQAALGETRALVGMSQTRRDGKPPEKAHEGITHIAGAGFVPTLHLDDLALPVCDLIYLDLEGFELFALKGAVRTIARCRPVLAIEINKNCAYYGIEQEQVRAFILAQGYHLVDRQRSDDVFVPIEGLP